MLILWILVGALCGWIAALLSRTNRTFNVSFHLTAGIIGALAGGLIAQLFAGDSVFFNPNSLFIALLASSFTIIIARFVLQKRV